MSSPPNKPGLSCPTPQNCSGCEPKCKGEDETVNIQCSKGNIKFRLRCKKTAGDTSRCGVLGNEIRYECEIIPEKNQCIDKSILESCDLKCKLCSAPGAQVTLKNIKYDNNAAAGYQQSNSGVDDQDDED